MSNNARDCVCLGAGVLKLLYYSNCKVAFLMAVNSKNNFQMLMVLVILKTFRKIKMHIKNTYPL